jgi:hopene-associated glycosyltransferase HpnB
VKLNCQSFAEKLLIPAFVYFFFMLYPPAWIRSRNRSAAGAAGGCMLIRAEALAKIGGIESLRGELIDDCALARRIKRSGGKVWLGLAENSRSLRRYGSFAEIGSMISRTAFNQLQHSALLLVICLLGMLLTFVLPVALLATAHAWPVLLGTLTWVLMTISCWSMVRFYGLNLLWTLLLPLSAIFYMGATVHSALMYWSGRGGEWKGRAQDVKTRAAEE